METLVRGSERFRAFLECKLCHKTLSLPSKVLPCLHFFCSGCLDQHVAISLLSSENETSRISNFVVSSDPSSLDLPRTCLGGKRGRNEEPQEMVDHDEQPRVKRRRTESDDPCEIKCPECSQRFSASPGTPLSAQDFHFAPFLLNQHLADRHSLDLARGQPISTPFLYRSCDACDPSLKCIATMHCLDCNKAMCVVHFRMHNRRSANHSFNHIGEPFQITPPSVFLQCPRHPPRIADGFCRKCSASVCPHCLDIEHEGHPVVPFAEVHLGLRYGTDRKIGELKTAMQKVKEQIQSMFNLKRTLRAELMTQDERSRALIIQVCQLSNSNSMEQIERLWRPFIMEIERKTKERDAAVEKLLKVLRVFESRLMSLINMNLHICQSTDIHHFQYMIPMLTMQCWRLKNLMTISYRPEKIKQEIETLITPLNLKEIFDKHSLVSTDFNIPSADSLVSLLANFMITSPHLPSDLLDSPFANQHTSSSSMF